MIIRDVDKIEYLRLFKKKLYDFARSINAVVADMDITFFQLFVVQLIIMFPFISILFKYEDYFPSVISQIFRSFLITNLINNMGVSQNAIYSLIIVIYLLVLLFTAFHLTFESVFAPITKLLGFLLKFSHLLIVPLVDSGVQSYLALINPGHSISRRLIGGVAAFLIATGINIVCFQAFFEIRMVRKKTVFWCFDNSFHFYGLVFTLFKTATIAFQTTSMLSICIISIGFYTYHSSAYSGIVGEAERLIETSLDIYIVITDGAVIASILTNDKNLAFGLWLSGMAFAMTISIITIFQRNSRKLYLPTCDCPPEAFYNFYYCYREELKGDDGSGKPKSRGHPSYIYHLHRFHCKDGCQLKKWLSISDERDIESVVDAIIEFKKGDSIHNRIVAELWNLQRGKKCNLAALTDKWLTVNQDFIVYCIQMTTKDTELTIESNEANKATITKAFYDLIYDSANHYYLFYEELSRAQPVIDCLINHGTQIRKKIAKLKQIYWELQKQQLINFKMIQLYIGFLTKFVSEKALQKEDLSQLAKLQQSPYFEDISEIYLPTLAFYPETGKIENANGEAQKLLQLTRFQLKCKELSDLTEPQILVEQLQELATRDDISLKQQPLYLFFRKSAKIFCLGSISVAERTIKGKKLLIMQITEDQFSSQKTAFLVTNEFKLEVVLREVSTVKTSHRGRPLTIRWQEIFHKHILANRENIERSRTVRISIDSCSVVVQRLNSAVPGYFILKSQILLINESAVGRQRSNRNNLLLLQKSVTQYHREHNFRFHYTENSEHSRALLVGMRGTETEAVSKLKLKTLSALEKGLNGLLVDSFIKQQHDFARGIKTYRLYDGDLYNIELEDKAAYEEAFEGKVVQAKENDTAKDSNFQCYLGVGIVLISLVLMGFSVAYIINFNSSSNVVETLSIQHTNIDALLIDYYRILALLRNLNSEFRQKFPNFSVAAEIGDSFNRVEVLKTKPLFNSQTHTIHFLGLTMEGTFLELVDVMFAHVNEVLSSGNATVIEEIESTGIELSAEMEDFQREVFAELGRQIDTLTLLKNTMVYCSMGVVVIIFILFILFCYYSSQNMMRKLFPILYITDEEAHVHQENAAKIKYAVEMIRKNFEVDTQSLLIDWNEAKKRKYPKKVGLSKGIIVTIIILACGALALHLTSLLIFSRQLQLSLQRSLSMKSSSGAIVRAYGEQAQIANYLAGQGQLEPDQMQEVASHLEYITFNTNSLEYSPALNEYIHTLYFHNSCALLMPAYNMTLEECTNTAPEYTIKNPFEIGLAYYLNRQFFYFNNNRTEVQAHTNVHSRRFAEILTNLSQSFNTEGIETIAEIKATINQFNYIIIAVDACYIIAFFSIYYYFYLQTCSIKKIIEFLREKLVVRPAEEQEEGTGNKTGTQRSLDGHLERESTSNQRQPILKSTTLQKQIRFQGYD